MRIAVFSTKSYDQDFFNSTNKNHELVYFEPRLKKETASLASGFDAVCVFVNDSVQDDVLEILHEQGTKLIALRCAGFNNVDLKKAKELGITVCRVPAYSPHAVAEHTITLIQALNRKVHRAYNRVREGNFSLQGLLGFDLYGKTVGVVGTGTIGTCVTRIMKGFGCEVVAYDLYPNEQCTQWGVEYTSLERLFSQSDIITLHCPLTSETKHLINREAIRTFKDGAMLINTSRGALIDTPAVIEALKSGKIGHLGLDVYEEEEKLFFDDLSGKVLTDDVFARLLTFPNVLITGHQAFFTDTALEQIAETTLNNISAFERGESSGNEVSA